MRILVTGGSGRLGQFTIAELLEHGHEVINADQRAAPGEDPSVPWIETDLSDVGAVAGTLKDCDARIHLGAIPNPYRHPDEVVFRNNTGATYGVLQAAYLLGIERAVIASSASAYGMAWTRKPFPPLFVPLDETHPLLVYEPYGLSKEVDERTAEMFHRRCEMQIAALRFHWVASPDELLAIADRGGVDPAPGANNLWGYVDCRDAASACRLAIEANGLGFEAFNITAADTLCAGNTEDLLAEYLPTTEFRAPIPGHGSGFAIKKATRLLNWTPHHSWRAG